MPLPCPALHLHVSWLQRWPWGDDAGRGEGVWSVSLSGFLPFAALQHSLLGQRYIYIIWFVKVVFS